MFDEVMVSTDSIEYAEIAKLYDAKVPFMRNSELSNDTASSWDVVRDVLNKYKEAGKEFDTVALLQPTSPLRTAEDIVKGYKVMKDKSANSVIGVCEVDHSPLWMNTLPEDNSMGNFINPKVVGLPRQKLDKYYRINGALYIIRTDTINKIDNLYNDKCYALIMDKKRSIDIDDEYDFLLAEVLMKNCFN